MKAKILSTIFTLPIILTYLLWPKPIYATDPPSPTNPSNGSSVSSSTLTWTSPSGTLASSNPYRVQISATSDFIFLKKDYYSANTSYTPTLDSGSWYWRVKAKDPSNNWSDWSTVWSFTLGPAASPSPTQEPTPSPTPTQAASANQSQLFEISDIPSSIHYNDSFSVTVKLQNFPANTQYYLKGAFIESGGSNYFGQTQVSGNWIKNNQSYSSQFPVTTDSSGSWEGVFEVIPDSSDSGFSGAGTYIFKVARYSASGSGPTWSNQFNIDIIDAPPPESTDESDPSPTPSPDPTSQASPSPSTKTTATLNKTLSTTEATHQTFTLPDLSSNSASIAGLSTNSGTITKPITFSKMNFFTIAGLVTLLLAGIPLIYMVINKKFKYALPNPLSRGNPTSR